MFTQHYKPKKISQLSPKDSRVALTGSIVQKRENSFILDDGTARTEIFFDGKVEAKVVRAFCSVVEDKLKADVVQNLDSLDINLFKKVEELYNRYYV